MGESLEGKLAYMALTRLLPPSFYKFDARKRLVGDEEAIATVEPVLHEVHLMRRMICGLYFIGYQRPNIGEVLNRALDGIGLPKEGDPRKSETQQAVNDFCAALKDTVDRDVRRTLGKPNPIHTVNLVIGFLSRLIGDDRWSKTWDHIDYLRHRDPEHRYSKKRSKVNDGKERYKWINDMLCRSRTQNLNSLDSNKLYIREPS